MFEDAYGIDILSSVVQPFFHNEITTVNPSSKTSYPDHYKFTSVNFFAHARTPIVSRTPYGILDLFGDIGGLNDFLGLFFSLFVGIFPLHRINALMAEWLYSQRDL